MVAINNTGRIVRSVDIYPSDFVRNYPVITAGLPGTFIIEGNEFHCFGRVDSNGKLTEMFVCAPGGRPSPLVTAKKHRFRKGWRITSPVPECFELMDQAKRIAREVAGAVIPCVLQPDNPVGKQLESGKAATQPPQ
ncbi:hypothetical protein F53441_12314 [Fusarium austroafricanum]|uniref:Uncharacterized protein n=1 Tax=Fusarium austroafricanum TaxID=2364996 RepID=A0A8H4JYJ5_9HYPO|nr:hypothetical protein F53441_12314 [Fusarium austroafricanum]